MLFHLNDFLPVWLSSVEHAHTQRYSEEANSNCVFVHTLNVNDFHQGNNMKIVKKKKERCKPLWENAHFKAGEAGV